MGPEAAGVSLQGRVDVKRKELLSHEPGQGWGGPMDQQRPEDISGREASGSEYF